MWLSDVGGGGSPVRRCSLTLFCLASSCTNFSHCTECFGNLLYCPFREHNPTLCYLEGTEGMRSKGVRLKGVCPGDRRGGCRRG